MIFSAMNALNNFDKPDESGNSPKQHFDINKILKKEYKPYKEYRNKTYLPLMILLSGIIFFIGNIFLFLFTLVPIMDVDVYYNDDGSFAFIDTGTSLWNAKVVNGEITYTITPMLATLIVPILASCFWAFTVPFAWFFISRNKIKNTFFIDKFDEIYKPNLIFNKYTFIDCKNLKKSILMYVQCIVHFLMVVCTIYLFFVAFEKPYVDSLQNTNRSIFYLWSGYFEPYSIDKNGLIYKVCDYKLKPNLYTILASVFLVISFFLSLTWLARIHSNVCKTQNKSVIEKLKDKLFFQSLNISKEAKEQIIQIIIQKDYTDKLKKWVG